MASKECDELIWEVPGREHCIAGDMLRGWLAVQGGFDGSEVPMGCSSDSDCWADTTLGVSAWSSSMRECMRKKVFDAAKGIMLHQAQPQSACNINDSWHIEVVSVTSMSQAEPMVTSHSHSASHPPSPDFLPMLEIDPDYIRSDTDPNGREHRSPSPAQPSFAESLLLLASDNVGRVVVHFTGAGLMANYLLTSKLSMSALDKFLSLEVTKKMSLSFLTAKELHAWAGLLPLGKMDYMPFCLFTMAECIVRVFTEWMSSDGAWDKQSQIPEGATLCGVILSLDKINITNMCGGRVVHPLLISLANIKMAV
ncbi:hypothetical protein J3A83DRAFT_4193473 [Scleroderma citrinum]